MVQVRIAPHLNRLRIVTLFASHFLCMILIAGVTGCTKRTTGPAKTNHAPVLDAIQEMTGWEGDNFNFRVHATDPDSTIPTLVAVGVPAHAVFTDSGNGAASFVFTPDSNELGIQPVTFIASDGSLADTEQVTITVQELPPNLLSNGSFEIGGQPSMSGWSNNSYLVSIDTSAAPGGGFYSLEIGLAWIEDVGYSWAQIPQVRKGDIIAVSAAVQGYGQYTYGQLGIRVGPGFWTPTRDKWLRFQDTTWATARLVDTLSIESTDSVWVVLRGARCELCVGRPAHFDLVAARRLGNVGH